VVWLQRTADSERANYPLPEQYAIHAHCTG
jgi:hypothetical protein